MKEDGALNGAVNVILPDTVECTVVVPDLEKSVRVWSDIFDIKVPTITAVEETCTFRGRKVYAEFKAARIDEAPFTLYLVENHGVGPFAEFADKNDSGIHHITFEMGEKCEAFAAHLKDTLDIDVLTEYDLDGAHYIVFDSIEKMGAYIAIR